jgi:hypothetical protein
MRIAGLNSFLSFSRGGFIGLFLGLACAAGCALGLTSEPAAAQGTPEQRTACQPDALRLCSEFVPDVDRITACMLKNRIRLSPPCRVLFKTPPKAKSFKRAG